MANKKKQVKLTLPEITNLYEEEYSFEDLIMACANRTFSIKNLTLSCKVYKDPPENCILGLITTLRLKNLPPIGSLKQGADDDLKKNEIIEINLHSIPLLPEEGLAYANVFLYDKQKRILWYEYNRDSCSLSYLSRMLSASTRENNDNVRCNISFLPILKSEAYKMENLSYLKRIQCKFYDPGNTIRELEEDNNSIAQCIKNNAEVSQQNNANIVSLELSARSKKANPMGLKKNLISQFSEVVHRLRDKGKTENVKVFRIEGYVHNEEDGKDYKELIDLLAESYKDWIKLSESHAESNLQEFERKSEIKRVYNKMKNLPGLKDEIK